MLLRRMIEHVKAQNWTAVALDFFIVVAGVFVGLQVQQWAIERDRQKSERDYLGRLHSEVVQLMATREIYNESRKRLSADLIGAVDLLNQAEGNSVLSEDQCDAIAGSANTTVPPAELPTLTELLSTGRLDQLTSDSVRSALLNFMQDVSRSRDLIAAISRSGIDLGNAFPLLITHHLGSSPRGPDGLWLNPDCETVGMRADPGFRNALSENTYKYYVYTDRAVLPVSRQLALLHAALDAEIGVDHAQEAESTP